MSSRMSEGAWTFAGIVALLCVVVAGLGAFAIWGLTIVGLWLQGQGFLALVAFFMPPAEYILAWLVSPVLGLGTIAVTVLWFTGNRIRAAWEMRDAVYLPPPPPGYGGRLPDADLTN